MQLAELLKLDYLMEIVMKSNAIGRHLHEEIHTLLIARVCKISIEATAAAVALQCPSE